MTTYLRLDLRESRCRYVRETRRRMDRAIADLRALRDGDLAKVDRVLGGLRLQEGDSRLAGFPGIARLCRDLGNRLTEFRIDGPSRLATEADTLSAVCLTIQRHADTVGKSLSGPGDADVPQRTITTDVAHSTPPAPTPARVTR